MSELEAETVTDRVEAPTEETVETESVGKQIVRKWLNKSFRIEMTDGRVLVGIFLCTDRDANIILGSCSEYLKDGETTGEEPRILGLVMVPGRHIVSIEFDENYIAPNLPNE